MDNVVELARVTSAHTPGLQYVVIDAQRVLFDYTGGWADIQNQKPMTLDTTLMAYSMTKTFTAVAVLQCAEQGALGVDDELDRYLPNTPYRGQHITVRQLLDHTSGIPNPIPLRWVHLVADQAQFDENAALAQVLRRTPKLAFAPGQRFAYSNLGYWLLGKIIERVSGQAYVDVVTANVCQRLSVDDGSMGFVIRDASRHAKGYLAKYSLMNLIKPFVVDREVIGGYEGNWLEIKSHYPNGPAFGGLIGTACSISRFLQDQLRAESVLLRPDTKRLLETQQTDSARRPIPMTLGWHMGTANSVPYFFKEGGGGGCHNEMRLYPAKRMASVVMSNSTGFDVKTFLNRMDSAVGVF